MYGGVCVCVCLDKDAPRIGKYNISLSRSMLMLGYLSKLEINQMCRYDKHNKSTERRKSLNNRLPNAHTSSGHILPPPPTTS